MRKRLVEVQYLRATITQEQRESFGAMVASTLRQIDTAALMLGSDKARGTVWR